MNEYSSVASDTSILLVILLYIIVLVVPLVSLWKIYIKAGKPGWASIVPIYSYIVWFQIIKRPWWTVFLLLIPLINILIIFMMYFELAASFKKGVWFTIGLYLLPFIFFPILAFSDAKYNKSRL